MATELRIAKEHVGIDGLPKSLPRPRKSTVSNKRGPKPVEVKFPEILKTILDAIKASAPRADARRRNQIIETGVSLEELKKIIEKTHPSLIGIDKRTIARLMLPPRKNTNSARSYKGSINARIQPRANDLRISGADSHYSMASTACIEVMCAYLGEDALNFSADEKAAFVVGPAGLVSRYHQNNNITEAGVIINRFDHDYKFAKYLIGMTGYLELNNPDVFETYFDALGRERIKAAVSGEVHTNLHSKLHAKADLLMNMDELRSRLEAAQEADELPSVVSVCVDGEF